MKILALEFSSARRSAAVLDFSGSRAEVIETVEESLPENSRFVSPFIFLKQLRALDSFKIEGIAVGLGPGSYTGIRSSLAIAQGWNLAHRIPAAGISSMDAVARCALNHTQLSGNVEVVVDAQRGEVYSAEYQLSGLLFRETTSLRILSKPDTQKPVGPDALKFSPEGVELYPTAVAVGSLALHAQFGPPELLEPIYLREPSFAKAPAVRHV